MTTTEPCQVAPATFDPDWWPWCRTHNSPFVNGQQFCEVVQREAAYAARGEGEVTVVGAVTPRDFRLKDIAPGLIEALRLLGDEYGPLGVAQAAALLTDKYLLVKILTRADIPQAPLIDDDEDDLPRSVFPSEAGAATVPLWDEDEDE